VHLLQSIASFLQQLQGEAPGAAGATAMPVTSLALGGTTGEKGLLIPRVTPVLTPEG
jgi:hypothetical protein